MKISRRSIQTLLKLSLLISTLSFASFARSELAIIVNPDNPAVEYSQKDIKKLFLGRAQLFPGTSKRVVLLDQPETQKSYQEFYELFVKIRVEKLKRYRAAYLFSGRGSVPVELESDEKVKDYVANNDDAIGYIDASLVDASVKTIYKFPSD